jgi:hypothetical protein
MIPCCRETQSRGRHGNATASRPFGTLALSSWGSEELRCGKSSVPLCRSRIANTGKLTMCPAKTRAAASNRHRCCGPRLVRLPRLGRHHHHNWFSASARTCIPVVCSFACIAKNDPARGEVRALAGLSTAPFGVNSLLERSRSTVREEAVKLRILPAATLSLFCLLCAAAPVQAQDAPSSFLTWLKHVTRAGTHHRHASLPPLPKARPAEAGPAAVAPDRREAVTPNKMSEAIPD